MARMLADGKDKLLWVPDGGIADLAAPTVTELTAVGVVDLSFLVSKNNFALGPTGDADITDTPLGAEGETTAPGRTQYEASMEFYRYTETAEDIPWSTFTGKGIEGILVHRSTAKESTEAIAATDEVAVYESITGTPVPLGPGTDAGYKKFRQGFHVQRAELRAVVSAAA